MEKARVQLLTEYPFYSSMLSQCVFSWTTKIPTAGVRITKDANVELVVNKEFFYKLTEQQRVGLLQHEMLHIAMNHLTRGKDLDKRVGNIAMDISINQYIKPELLPPGALLPAQFKLPVNKAFEVYYAELMKKQPPKDTSTIDDHSQWESKPGDDQDSQDGNSAGKEGEGEENDSSSISDELKDEIMSRMTEKAAKDSESGQPGSTPQHVLTELSKQLGKKPQVNWRAQLRSFVGKHLSDDRESTHTRVNRRLGFKAAGSRRIDSPHVLIGIDQSGSVSEAQQQLIMTELKGILACMQDKVEICYFDTEIAHKEKLKKVKTELKRYASGGTDFQCIVDYANKVHPDIIIMLTDGESSMPRGSKTPIVWALIGDSADPSLRGHKVYVKDSKTY